MRTGVSIVEVVAVVGCVGLLAGLLQTSLREALGVSARMKCLERLHAIGEASLTYSQRDPGNAAIPVHRLQFQQDPSNPTYIGAYEWGGKSGVGREGWTGWYGPLSSKYGTFAGFGPATRPLNDILYPHGFVDYEALRNRQGATRDTQQPLDAYRCPGDDGPPDGAHCPDWIANTTQSSFDHFGTSYAANLFMIGQGGGGQMVSNSPYLRTLDGVPYPGRTISYEDNIGRWAWAARAENSECYWLGPGIDPGPTGGLRGWHGKDWTYNRAFLDGHAATQTIFIEGTANQEGYGQHYYNQQLSFYPGWPACDQCLPGEADCPYSEPGTFESYRCIIVRGDGWSKDTLPAPFICSGLPFNGVGRPSYEDCVTGE